MKRLIDIQAYACRPDAPLRLVMERLNEATYPIQLVLDAEGRLAGTVTDGDIRRAILRGVRLDDPVAKCMHDKPFTGRVGRDEENLAKLRSVIARTPFLPVVDDLGKVDEILIIADGRIGSMRALIMAGGFGRRLGPITKSTPKPLLLVGGRPILDHLIERLEAASVDEIFISVHYLAERIERFVEAHRTTIPITLVREDAQLGTAGAVGLLPDGMSEPLLVVNGDVLTSLDFGALMEFHLRHDSDATLAVAQHQVDIPFGVVRHAEDGRFLGIEEKPTITNFVSAGIYCLAPEFRALVRHGEKIDMPALLERGQKAGLKVSLFPIHEYWTDVGRPGDLERADVSQISNATK